MSNNTISDIVTNKLQELIIVGFRVQCPGDQYAEKIPKAAKEVTERLHEINHLVQPIKQIGAFKAAESTDDEDGYWVGFEVTKLEDVPTDMTSLTIPEQTYAILPYTGQASGIFGAYAQIHQWNVKNGQERLTNYWSLEIYNDWENPQEVDVLLCDPVKVSDKI
ncbi:GyrI-like domain-containing protein [Ornithinibacillus salinisoli]|uniref:GyrI-like domain-containing protein n=1 Tax=Ornithinibacillus salinisoli TaxID=1848459 RepID=A0ABW4VVE9_9BACI